MVNLNNTVKKSTAYIIGEYVERKDVIGLAEFVRAMIGDDMIEKEKMRKEIAELKFERNNLTTQTKSNK